MTDIKKLLGKNIRAYRLKNGLTQEKLAEMANTATNYLGLIECGKKFPSAEMIEKVALALQIDPSNLFALAPVKQDWQREILEEMNAVISSKLMALDGAAAAPAQ